MQASRGRSRAWVIAGSIGVLVLLGFVLFLARPQPVAPLTVGDDPVLGEASAPVTIYYFADFQCPFCRRFELDGTMDRLRTNYIDTGGARLVFKDLPILGDDSWVAAEASQFVWDRSPSSYWAWHRGLYEIQGPERSGWASADRIVAYSSTVPGVDAVELKAALDSRQYRNEVQADKTDGTVHGVQGTPTLVIGDRSVNALDYGAVEAAISAARGGR